MIIAIPVAAVILGVVFATQANEMGLGATMVLHIHPKLNVTVNGKTIQVPEQIGIDKPLYKDLSLDKYGMQGMAPLHTHDNSGVIHVESAVNRDYTLGEFLKIWGVDLNGKSVKVTVNGQPISDWRNHILSDGEQINLEIGR
jgi:sulfur carrier protein ThiS